MPQKPSIAIILSIFGDYFDIDELTKRLNIKPSESWYKNDKIERSTGKGKLNPSVLLRKETSWKYSTGYIESFYLDEVSPIFIRQITPHTASIMEFLAQNDLRVKIDLVVNAYIDASPSLIFSPEFIDLAKQLNIGIEVDLYISANN